MTVTGGLDLWPADPAIPKSDYTESLAAEGVPFELLDGDEIMRRWPQWRLDDGMTAMFQAQGGLADPFKGNAAHRRLAQAHGATLLDRTPVTAIREAGGGAGAGRRRSDPPDADRGDRRRRLDQPAAGSFDRRLPLTITKEQVTYFAAPDPAAFAPDRFPVWIWMDDPSFYGFPTYGEAGPKAAQDCGGQAVDPDRAHLRARRARLRAASARSWRRHLPGALGPPIYTKTCLYTLTPDRDFVVDRLPEAPGVMVAARRRRTASSSPPCSAGSRPRWASMAARRRRRSSSDSASTDPSSSRTNR